MKMLLVVMAMTLAVVSAVKPQKYIVESAPDIVERAARCTEPGLHSCDNGQCIQQEWVCDMETDCFDGSDEKGNCSTDCSGQHQFQCDASHCISSEFRCDGKDDCLDGTDEHDCHLVQCPVGEMKCANELCVESMWFCDGQDDCTDNSDETNCTTCQHGFFRCANASMCINHSQVCDGNFNCADHSDELDCGPRPPAIVVQPSGEMLYKPLDTVRLPCEALGSPSPVYTWTHNGFRFYPGSNDDRVRQLPGVGTLVFSRAQDKDEGVYQCSAVNRFGTSLSLNVKLRMAALRDFETARDRTERPFLGMPLTLQCVPPESQPPAQVSWFTRRPQGGLDPVHYDARVTMDLEYRLRFSNVETADDMGGRAYVCVALNSVLRKSTMGPQFFIQPLGGTAELTPVDYMWASPDDSLSLRGERVSLKCIFSGNPTPDVHWERVDGASLPPRAQIQSFGQELVIEDVQFEDAGTYRCWATNRYSQTRVQRTLNVRVDSLPYWVLEPRDVEIRVGGTAHFNCRALAVPEPEYSWYINGVPLADVTDGRITPARLQRPRPDYIVFSDLTRQDSLVVQCNASNKHGYLWGDVFLHVH